MTEPAPPGFVPNWLPPEISSVPADIVQAAALAPVPPKLLATVPESESVPAPVLDIAIGTPEFPVRATWLAAENVVVPVLTLIAMPLPTDKPPPARTYPSVLNWSPPTVWLEEIVTVPAVPPKIAVLPDVHVAPESQLVLVVFHVPVPPLAPFHDWVAALAVYLIYREEELPLGAGGQAGRVLPIFGAGALVHDRLDKDSPAVIALALQEAGHETPAQAGSLGVGLTAALQRARTAAGLENRNQR